jgi:hypothetical protein
MDGRVSKELTIVIEVALGTGPQPRSYAMSSMAAFYETK